MTIPKHLYELTLRNAYAVGGFDAGGQMYNFYPTARNIFPVLSPTIEIMPDTAAGTFGLAWYVGRNPLGQPKFAVRDDLVLNSKIAWHEAGHALEEELIERRRVKYGRSRADEEFALRQHYWMWRGFPGTWWDAYLEAINTLGTSAGWAYLPGESIAESISAAVGGYVESEWTMNFGKDLALLGIPGGVYSPQAGGIWARQYWLQRMSEVDMDDQQIIAKMTQVANEAVERYAVQARVTGFEPIKDAFDDHKHFDTTGTRVITGIPSVTMGQR